jgi:hypothetical protein
MLLFGMRYVDLFVRSNVQTQSSMYEILNEQESKSAGMDVKPTE